MNVKLTQEELRLLLEMVYMANWMLSAHKTEEDPLIAPYESVEQKLLETAHRSGNFDDLIEYDAKDKTYWHTSDFDGVIHEKGFIKEYDEDTFWDELAAHLAYRDAIRQAGGFEQLAALPFEEYMRRLIEFEELYNQEFYTYGLERLDIKKTQKQIHLIPGKGRTH